MKDVDNQPHLFTLLCTLLVFLTLPAYSHATNSPGSTVQDEQVMLGDIKGVVIIESPKTGALLQLRGIAGRGMLISRETPTQQQDEAHCVSVPMRFAAGDFGGSSIGIRSVEPIQLVIYDDEVMQKLTAGDEVVSEDYDITGQNEARLGDIKIISGLTLSYGFVLNPGEWSWLSVFGQAQNEVSCERLNINDTAHTALGNNRNLVALEPQQANGICT
ncbi:hypothetical protein [Vreelandella alkaliphila]|uniref:hypothetical protein n=1 Tax=Vreelandella alkaliphila TaxID=272774 RepID=UPI003F98CA91